VGGGSKELWKGEWVRRGAIKLSHLQAQPMVPGDERGADRVFKIFPHSRGGGKHFDWGGKWRRHKIGLHDGGLLLQEDGQIRVGDENTIQLGKRADSWDQRRLGEGKRPCEAGKYRQTSTNGNGPND